MEDLDVAGSGHRGSDSGDRDVAPLDDGDTSPPAGLDAFDRFWRAYPKRHNRPEARRAWEDLRPTQALADALIADVEHRARTDPAWQRDERRYVPLPANYLRDRRWTDEPADAPAFLVPDVLGAAVLGPQPHIPDAPTLDTLPVFRSAREERHFWRNHPHLAYQRIGAALDAVPDEFFLPPPARRPPDAHQPAGTPSRSPGSSRDADLRNFPLDPRRGGLA